MLRLTIPGTEYFDEATETFSTVGDLVLEFEHSLAAVSKWEAEYQKPFLKDGPKTDEETIGYIRAMMITPDDTGELMARLGSKEISKINEYVESSQSATTFFESKKERKGKTETITSELIYYWMVSFNIPFECEHWHLNRLFSLIRICNLKNNKGKRMSAAELAARNRELNAQRRASLNTSG